MLNLTFMLKAINAVFACLAMFAIISGYTTTDRPTTTKQIVPREGIWGIYEIDLISQRIRLIYSTHDEIYSSALRISTGDRLVFAQKVNGTADNDLEIFTIGRDGSDLKRITDNHHWDLYPVWPPEGDHIAFLSQREKDLDIYVMDANGNNVKRLFDSGNHDADRVMAITAPAT